LLLQQPVIHRTSLDSQERPAALDAGYSLVEILFVVGLIGVISAIAVPMMANALGNFKLTGDVRSVSNAVAVAKMRAASKFTRVRLYVDLTGKAHHIEWLDTTVTPNHWTAEGGTTYLSPRVSFGVGPATAPPPNTQGTIGQAAQCVNDTGANIGNTACVVFNSRGVPVNNSLAPTPDDALYLTDGTAIYTVTVAATGMMRTWRGEYVTTPTWVLN
jgi:prepilin-type N-terminal cleavage/methylation domain-containing protein